MELHLFTFTDLHRHGDAFFGYLALRKQHFVDQLNWDLSHDGVHEMDQYDHPQATYAVVTDGGRVIGGARAMPCSANWAGWTYMLRDAWRGKAEYIPNDLMTHYPDTPDTWECTRLILADDLAAEKRALALKLVVFGLCDLVSDHGGDRMISLSPVVFGRVLKSIGYDAKACGRIYTGTEDGRRYRPFEMSCLRDVNADLCARYLPDRRMAPISHLQRMGQPMRELLPSAA